MLDYRLQVFRKVAELQSITRAARALHLSQPAVTRHVRLLEENLRVPLFIREPHGMRMTNAGLVYLQHVQQMAQAHENMAQHLQAATGVTSGCLRLGSNKTLLAFVLPERLASFKQLFPSVQCDVLDGNTETIIGALLDQRIDLALIEGPCQRPEIQTIPFLEDEIIWIASPNSPLAKIQRPSAETILAQPLIVREIGAGSRQFMENHLQHLKFAPARLNLLQEIPSPEAIKRLVATGLGIGYVFRISVQAELASGKLVQLNCPKLTLRKSFSLLYPQGPQPMGLRQAFIQVLMQSGKPHPATKHPIKLP